MITIKDFALQQGCSETIVYRHIRNHKEALGDRIQKVHGKTWLTDEGADYIRSLMTQAPVVVSEASAEVDELKQKLFDVQQKYTDYVANVTPLLQKASEQLALAESSEANQKRADALESQNADLKAENEKKDKLLQQAEKTAQTVSDELLEARKKIEELQDRKWYQLLFKKKREQD